MTSSDLVSIPDNLDAKDAALAPLLISPLKYLTILPLEPRSPLKPLDTVLPRLLIPFVATPTKDLRTFGIALNALPRADTKDPMAPLANLNP